MCSQLRINVFMHVWIAALYNAVAVSFLDTRKLMPVIIRYSICITVVHRRRFRGSIRELQTKLCKMAIVYLRSTNKSFYVDCLDTENLRHATVHIMCLTEKSERRVSASLKLERIGLGTVTLKRESLPPQVWKLSSTLTT